MEMELGKHSATRQSFHEVDMRELLMRLIDENPKANRHRLLMLFIEKMRDDDDYLTAAADYAVNNTLNTIERLKEQQESRRNGIGKPTTAEQQAKVGELIAKIEEVILLNLEMPNGKRMRFCTGTEMAKFGAGYARIAHKVGKTKTVGSVLSEQEVRALLVK